MDAPLAVSYRLQTAAGKAADGREVALAGVERNLLIRRHVQSNKENRVEHIAALCDKQPLLSQSTMADDGSVSRLGVTRISRSVIQHN